MLFIHYLLLPTLGVDFLCGVLVYDVILGIPSLASTKPMKGETVAFLELCCGCLALWLFLAVPWVDLWSVIVEFPGFTFSCF